MVVGMSTVLVWKLLLVICRNSAEPVEEFWKNERELWEVHNIASLYENFT